VADAPEDEKRHEDVGGVDGGDEEGLVGCVLPKPLTGQRGGGCVSSLY